MMLNLLRFAAILFSALGMGLGLAHALELPVKLAYDPALYMAVTSTLYRYYGLIGGPIQLLALIATCFLCWTVRRRPMFGLTLAACASLGVSLILWFALVQPVNAQWASALQAGPDAARDAYLRLRNRWEFGHLAAFIAWTTGFVGLLIATLRESPIPDAQK
jgi:hypothetical protein